MFPEAAGELHQEAIRGDLLHDFTGVGEDDLPSSRTSPGFDLRPRSSIASPAERVADKAVWEPPRERTLSFSDCLKKKMPAKGRAFSTFQVFSARCQ